MSEGVGARDTRARIEKEKEKKAGDNNHESLYQVQHLRSTCGERCQVRTRRIPAWRSTSAGRWTVRPG